MSALTGLMNLFSGGQGSTPIDPRFGIDPNVISGMQGAIGNYQNLFNQAQGGQGQFVQSAVNPAIATNAAGYGNLLQSQAERGIRGSSFGEQGIQNYTSAANQNVADITSKALQSSYGTLMGLNQGIMGGYGDIGQYESGNIARNLGYNQDAARIAAQNRQTNAGLFGNLALAGAGLAGGPVGAGIAGLFSGGLGPLPSGYSYDPSGFAINPAGESLSY